MNRRDTLLALFAVCALGSTLGAGAQSPRKVRRIGFLGPDSAAETSPYVDNFRAELNKLGYIEGQHFTIEERNADGKNERLAGFAAELVRLNIDVILAFSTPAATAARKATATIPIVFVGDRRRSDCGRLCRQLGPTRPKYDWDVKLRRRPRAQAAGTAQAGYPEAFPCRVSCQPGQSIF